LNHRKNMKAEPSQLIPRIPTENLDLSFVFSELCALCHKVSHCEIFQKITSNHLYHLYLTSFFFQSLTIFLTLWEPRYDIFVLWNQPKTNSCQLPDQHYSSSADCARELFKPSDGLASHFLVEGSRFFVSDVISEVVFGPFWLMLPDLGPNR